MKLIMYSNGSCCSMSIYNLVRRHECFIHSLDVVIQFYSGEMCCMIPVFVVGMLRSIFSSRYILGKMCRGVNRCVIKSSCMVRFIFGINGR